MKARLDKAALHNVRWERSLDSITTEAIRLGARAPDPRTALIDEVEAIIKRPVDPACSYETLYRSRSEEIVSFILDNAPKEG